MKFTEWLEQKMLLESGKKRPPNPVQMPKTQSNIVKPRRQPKQRIRKGVSDTTFRDRPKNRGHEERRSIEEQ